jgi:hypothetical protein
MLASIPAVAVVVGATLSVHASVKLSKPMPAIARQGAEVTVAGTVRHSSHGDRTTLELKRIDAGWVALAGSSPGRHGAFTIRWRVPHSEAPGPVKLRVALVHRHKLLAATAPAQSAIGRAAQRCAPPVPPAVNIPVGDGWIVGGAYGIGGAYPGIDQCLQRRYTVTATDSAGQIAASETVAGGHSYTLAPLPAGSYTLRAGACTGSATVTAGHQTTANADCLYP